MFIEGVTGMASNKEREKKQTRKEDAKELAKKTESSKKAIKNLKKEKKTAENLIEYCRSLNAYLTEQAAIEASNEELPAKPAEEKLREDFYSSPECADAFAAYRRRIAEEQAARRNAAGQPDQGQGEEKYENAGPETAGC